MPTTNHPLFVDVAKTIQDLDISSTPPDRQKLLQELRDYIQMKVSANEPVRLNFICTHNSRRSHLSQVWAQTLAHYFNIPKVFCYSGGTEATALFPTVIDALQGAGFQVVKLSKNNNPTYSIKYAKNEHPIIGFSKTMDHEFNPSSGFAAIMTCDSANEACPFVPGAEKRIPLTYEDPKAFDNTPQQAEKYKERSLHIASELFTVFSQIKL